ncbi:MAG: riboflavin synthase [Candidatus Dormibacteraeota bacterium]|uniref:Riboflavin synthase n=1 Tax=Candidatus Aeolococcus gillhamiae TaxID=3127015 RepID=A0A2W5ZBP3_9BACT|nr:riboflavin synthase [Candidatus Dormibacteraeota bacterium]PZR82799.1 MAG: riboflavin synthase [Candidatus Dormibacter sp. RRmetagenome_bin12]
MFTGIVEEVGQVDSVDAVDGRLRINCGEVLRGARRGDSIAVDGCCLTVTDFISAGFVSDVMPETFARTTLGSLGVGDQVNLEAALRHDGRVGGHLVTGHVDGVGRITAIRADGNATWVTIGSPPALMPLLVEKGCIAIDGISLTVVSVDDAGFTVSLIPHTRDHTIAGGWRVGSDVNLEGDLVAKYVQRGVAAHASTTRAVVLAAEG